MNTMPPAIPVSTSGTTVAPLPLNYESQPAVSYALHSPQAVAIATFLGSPAAGTALMAMNYRRLGRPGSAINAMVCGLLATAALIGLGFVLPVSVPRFPFALVSILIMSKLAKSLQGDAFDRHKLANGKIASLWVAAGIGVLGLAILVGVIFAIVMA